MADEPKVETEIRHVHTPDPEHPIVTRHGDGSIEFTAQAGAALGTVCGTGAVKAENAIGHVFTFPPEPAPDRWQRIHSRDELEAFYHHILPRIRAAARTCGYAIAVHGSMRRDLDLIAAPWVADHADRDALALAVSRAASGVGLDRFEWKEGEKPCGRVAVTLPICWCEWPDLPRDEKSTGCIDLSVMPDTILSQGTLHYDPMTNAFLAWLDSRPEGYTEASGGRVNPGGSWFDAFHAGAQWMQGCHAQCHPQEPKA